MKRFLVLMVAGLLVFTGCGGPKLIEKNRELGYEALEMVDKYLDGEIDSEELEDQMYAIGKKMVSAPEGMVGFENDEALDLAIFSIELAMRQELSWVDILSERNDIAKLIGAKKRNE